MKGGLSLAASLVLLGWSNAATAQPTVAASGDDVEESIPASPSPGTFEAVPGIMVPFEPTYDAWFGGDRIRPRFGRALLGIGILVALGLTYYWVDPLANKEDWDNPSLGDRLVLRSVRFDTNLNTTNHLLHPLAGGLVYGTARVNGLGVPVAFGLGAAQTIVWELALEWREKSSINDLVFTAVGGISVGELIFRTSDYFTSAPNGGGLPQRIAAWSLGFPRRILMALDGDKPPETLLAPDELGFSSAYGHRFALGYEVASLTNDEGADGLLHRVKLGAELVAIPGFLRPGRFQTTFYGGNFTEAQLRVGISDRGVDETDLMMRATLLGHFGQRFARTDDGGVEGHAAMLGVGPGLRYQKSNWLGRADQLSTIHLPGAQAEVWLADDELKARFSAEAYPDFGSVESLAFPEFVGRYGPEGTKSVLRRQGYAYSLGFWARARAAIALGPFAIAGSAALGHYDSIEGLDRFQERVTRDVNGSEEVVELEAGASVSPIRPLTIGVGVRERRRESDLGDVRVRRWDRDAHLTIGFVF